MLTISQKLFFVISVVPLCPV